MAVASPDMKLVVKRTFLELVDVDAKAAGPARTRGFTDSACLTPSSIPSSSHVNSSPSSPPLTNILEEEDQQASANLSAGDCANAHCYTTPLWELQREPMPHAADYPPHLELPSVAQSFEFMLMSPADVGLGAGHYGGWPPHAAAFQDQMAYSNPSVAAAMPLAGQEQLLQACRTTIMLRQLPKSLTRDMLIDILDNLGFAGKYDFVYSPVDFSTGVGLGYAFVNLLSPEDVEQVWACFEGFSNWESSDSAACTVSWSDPHQGLAVHVERYRNSPVMHSIVPESWKPAVFVNGAKAVFPFPTKKIKAPKIKHRS